MPRLAHLMPSSGVSFYLLVHILAGTPFTPGIELGAAHPQYNNGSLASSKDGSLQDQGYFDLRPTLIAQSPTSTKPDTRLSAPGVKGANQYLARVQARINMFWTAPPVDISGKSLLATVRFSVHRDGQVTGIRIEQSSGNDYYDWSATRAVQSAIPFPAFPPDLIDSYYDALFTFSVGPGRENGSPPEGRRANTSIEAPVAPIAASPDAHASANPASDHPPLATLEQTLIAPISDFNTEIEKYDSQIRQYQDSVSSKHALLTSLGRDTAALEGNLKEAEMHLSPIIAALEHAKTESDQTKKTLQAAIDNPRLVDAAKLDALLKESQVAASNLEQAQKEASVAQKEAETLKLRLEEARRQRRLIELEIAVTNRTILSLLMKRPVVVDGEGECAMHEDLTPKLCKELALARAKQNAVEKGGSSLVQSYAEVSLNDLIRDEITIETNAHVRQMEIVQPPTRVEDGALGKYMAKIRAVVQNAGPALSTKQNSGPLEHALALEAPPALNLPPPRRSDDDTPTSSFNSAYKDYLNGKYDVAIVGFRRFLDNFPHTSLTPNAHFWIGDCLFQKKAYERAIQAFEMLARTYPGSDKVPAALLKVGISASELGDFGRAKQAFRRVIEEYSFSEEAKLAKVKAAAINR